MRRSGLYDALGPQAFFDRVHEAVTAPVSESATGADKPETTAPMHEPRNMTGLAAAR